MKRIVVIASLVLLAACGSSSPTAPATPQTPTRVIAISGDLNFGAVQYGTSASKTLTVANQGNATLTVSGLSANNGIVNVTKASWTSGAIAPGASQPITITFTPVGTTSYSGTVTVTSDATSGGNTIPFSGSGSLSGIPVFTMSGVGNTVFDLPPYVTRARIVGTYAGASANFIVYAGGQLIVNALLGSLWQSHTTDGIYLVSGTPVQIKDSDGVVWSLTEVRGQ